MRIEEPVVQATILTPVKCLGPITTCLKDRWARTPPLALVVGWQRTHAVCFRPGYGLQWGVTPITTRHDPTGAACRRT